MSPLNVKQISDYQAGIAGTRGCKYSLRNRMQSHGRRDMIERACGILYAQLLRIRASVARVKVNNAREHLCALFGRSHSNRSR